MRILVAQEDPGPLHLLETSLAGWGYRVTCATDGRKAFEVLKSLDSPRLAILDDFMPHMHGTDICREIRRSDKPPYVYILMLTSRDRKRDIIEGLRSGADDYLTKPYDPHELRARLEAGKRIVEIDQRLVLPRRLGESQQSMDPLTGVWSRKTILDAVKLQLALSFRSGSPMGLVLANIDRFREINNTFGPPAGDSVLQEVAKRFRSVLRPPDSIGRTDADEFAMLLPGCDAPTAARMAESFRARIDRRAIESPEGVIALTVSVGVMATPSQNSLDLANAWRLVSEAVSRAKSNGRDRVEFAVLSNQQPVSNRMQIPTMSAALQ